MVYPSLTGSLAAMEVFLEVTQRNESLLSSDCSGEGPGGEILHWFPTQADSDPDPGLDRSTSISDTSLVQSEI